MLEKALQGSRFKTAWATHQKRTTILLITWSNRRSTWGVTIIWVSCAILKSMLTGIRNMSVAALVVDNDMRSYFYLLVINPIIYVLCGQMAIAVGFVYNRILQTSCSPPLFSEFLGFKSSQGRNTARLGTR